MKTNRAYTLFHGRLPCFISAFPISIIYLKPHMTFLKDILHDSTSSLQTYSNYRLTIGYLKATLVHIRVTLGHLRVTIGHLRVTVGYFFL